MRVLLVQPGQGRRMGFRHLALVEPLGLEMVAGSLLDEHEVAILDLRIFPGQLESTLADFNPDLCGISSTFTIDLYRTLEIAETAKAANPRTFVIVGGHHASLNPTAFHHPAIDAIALGEGETIAKELAGCLQAGDDPARVPGLIINQPQGQTCTGHLPPSRSLDHLPYPARWLTKAYRDRYYLVTSRPIATLESSRGCPYRCNFCSVWRFYQGRTGYKSPERVVSELETIEEQDVLFVDDNFLLDIRRARQIARLLKERGLYKRYKFEARSDAIATHPDVIALWREVGLNSVFMGFEAPDEAGLEAVNKHNSVENNERALEVLRAHDIEPTASFIVHPDYERSDFQKLHAYVQGLGLRLPAFTVLTPLPGTVLFEDLRDRILTTNYELFDLLHSVLPTHLPASDFYREFANLYRSAYSRWRILAGVAYVVLRDLWHRNLSPAHWRALWAEGRKFTDPAHYLEDLAGALAELEMAGG